MRAILMPASEALRAPTMATAGSAKDRGRRPSRQAAAADCPCSSASADSRPRRCRRSARRPAGGLQFGLGFARPTGCAAMRLAPPEIISSGSISSAASAEPKRLIRSRKVAGPTFGVRIRRSQFSRCRSLRRGAGGRLVHPLAPIRPRCRRAAAKCWRGALKMTIRLITTKQPGNLRRAQEIERDRHDDRRRQRRQRGVAEQEGHREPDDGEDQRHLPGERRSARRDRWRRPCRP